MTIVTPPNALILPSEARLAGDKNILVLFPGASLDDLSLGKGQSFFGSVFTGNDIPPDLTNKDIFVCGNVAQAPKPWRELLASVPGSHIRVVEDLCTNSQSTIPSAQAVGLGRLPIMVNGVGVLYRKFFEPGNFQRIQAEHDFQALKFSNKPGTAHRTGIYLTKVDIDRETNDKHFRLLRCSTNLAGPTADFQATDEKIVNALGDEASAIFENAAPPNHVLAQIYNNNPGSNRQKQSKASIKAHADKTKDMPANGVMAFCTFYDGTGELKPMGAFDYGHKGVSGLTKLHFSLKSCVRNNPNNHSADLAQNFSVTLYPDSVFFMPLSTNRWYTHEIRPGGLEARMLPTRMGYVVRCAATEAVHKSVAPTKDGPDSATFIKTADGELVQLELPTQEGLAELHGMYKEENISDEFIDYGQRRFLFSMNAGDYAEPMTYNARGGREEFQTLQMELASGPFEEFNGSTHFEVLGKGRQGTVLVSPDKESNVPIVRTTTKYLSPAQKFQRSHRDLAEQIQRRAALPTPFNNALGEIYDHQYTRMGFHSDQALDLLDGSYIALFSCYKHSDQAHNRKLVVEPKDGNPDGEKFEIELVQNSVVLFSLDTNRRFRHKIVLDHNKGNPESQEWLGLTFRTSKTFVKFDDKEKALLVDDTPLALLGKADEHSFYCMRSAENKEIDFHYPKLGYTISESDLIPPVD